LPARALEPSDAFAPALSPEARAIISEELGILKALREHLHGHAPQWRDINYDEALLELRDELSEAQEDEVAAIVHQMANLASLSSHQEQGRSEATLDPESPYFGHLRVEQDGRVRDILIGNRTLANSDLPYAIIDWRHAPISKVFYLYREGDEYEEEFGGKLVEGRILAHRKLMILGGRLVRVDCPAGVYTLANGHWTELPRARPALGGGAGSALRPESLERVAGGALLGVEHGDVQRTDKRLAAITGLIDPAQFEVITRPDSGVVIIDGGAGSGKTTIGLHRIAYLAYRDPARFDPHRMLAVVFGRALADYIAKLLPALGVEGVRIEVFESFMAELRQRHFPTLASAYDEATPATVVRFKQHPATLRYLEECVAARTAAASAGIAGAVAGTPSAERVAAAWQAWSDLPLAPRLAHLHDWVRGKATAPGVGRFGEDWLARQRLANHLAERHADLDQPYLLAQNLWEEAFLDLARLQEAMQRLAPGEYSPGQIEELRDWAFRTYSELEDQRASQVRQEELAAARADGEEPAADGQSEPIPMPRVDREDDTLLLLLYTRLVGPLRSRRRRALRFHHILVDEAQDFSPLDLQVLLGLAAEPRSITLAGDTDQRMVIHNAFTRWEDVVAHLGLESTAISPLQVGYRSTGFIMDFARAVLGPLGTQRAWIATRPGVPVDLLRFTDTGQAVAVLSDELLGLMRREPSASVALVARYPAQAQLYYEGLRRADLPGLRRVAEQDFSFAPGIEVTDVAQVKGLEFDYVVLLDVDQGSYPDDPPSRYLLHIAATRAAHQLLLVACRTPSPLLPTDLAIHLL
jgi:ATP-dependent DNA helicase UvrD/PcrA